MKRIFAAIAAILCLCLVLTGCSKAYVPNASPVADYEGRADSNYSLKPNGATATSAPSEAVSDGDSVFASRKVIRNAELTVQTLEFDDFMNGMLGKVNELGGYVERNSTGQRGTVNNRPLRFANVVVRIPADKLDGFLAEVDGLGNVTEKNEAVDDVTDRYTDTEARLASLRTEYDALLGLLAQADKLETIITLQDRLTDVRYEIESYEARLRSYDSLIAFSKVTMSVSEVVRETPVEEESFSQEVSRRFRESMEDVGEGFTDFAKWFLGDLPHIVLVLAFLAIPVAIVLACTRKSRRRRRALRKAEKERKAERQDNGSEG